MSIMPHQTNHLRNIYKDASALYSQMESYEGIHDCVEVLITDTIGDEMDALLVAALMMKIIEFVDDADAVPVSISPEDLDDGRQVHEEGLNSLTYIKTLIDAIKHDDENATYFSEIEDMDNIVRGFARSISRDAHHGLHEALLAQMRQERAQYNALRARVEN